MRFSFCFFIFLCWSCDKPIVIIGGGLAGLSAASEAIEKGATNVIIFDKEGRVGGNSAKATSGMNAAESEAQKEQNVEDSVAGFAYDTMLSGALGDPSKVKYGEPNELVEVLSKNSAAAVAFLASKGADTTKLVQCGGHSAKRTHRPNRGPAGWGFVSKVKAALAEKVEYRTGSKITDLIIENGAIKGIRYTDSENNKKEFQSDVVILASGGYANDHTENSLLKEFRPELLKVPTTNGKWATGDLVKIARKLGVGLVSMEAVQVHPTGFVDPKDPTAFTKFLAPEAIRGSGAVLINGEGKRFTDELGLRIKIVEAINNQPGPIRLLFNAEARDIFGPNMFFYQKKGFAVEYKTLTDLAKVMKIDVSVLESTVKTYNAAATLGMGPYGKSVFPVTFDKDEIFIAAIITPVIHYTMGGLAINANAQILYESGEPVKGLYGAGEITGGVHGLNRLAGNSLLECVVYGRISGENAVNEACGVSGEDKAEL